MGANWMAYIHCKYRSKMPSTAKMKQEVIFFEEALRKVNTFLKISFFYLNDENTGKSLKERLRIRWFFLFLGIWHNMDTIAEIAWLIDAIRTKKTLVEMTFLAPALAHTLLANVKTFYFVKHEDLVNEVIRSLKMLQMTDSGHQSARPEVDYDIRKRMSFLIRAMTVLCWVNSVALLLFAIIPFIFIASTYFTNGEIQLLMPFPVLYPFDVTDIKYWPYAYIREMYAAIVVVFLVLAIDCFYYTCCTFIQIQFQSLQYEMERFITNSKKGPCSASVRREKFVLLVKRHQVLIRCVDLLEQVYSKSTLFNVVTSSFLICLTGFNITAIDNLPLMMPFIAFLAMEIFQILVFCYFGDQLTESSLRLSNAVYNCQWYNAEVSLMKDLLLVLTRAHKPCELTAFGFSEINLRTFTRILSTAWSYFALLTTMNH